MPDKKILAITYNSRLKTETRERTEHLKNVKVHSYHSLGLEFYIKPCHDDMALLMAIQNGLPCYSDYDPTYSPDIIVLDETQDMTPIYYNLIRKVIADMNPTLGMPTYPESKHQHLAKPPKFFLGCVYFVKRVCLINFYTPLLILAP